MNDPSQPPPLVEQLQWDATTPEAKAALELLRGLPPREAWWRFVDVLARELLPKTLQAIPSQFVLEGMRRDLAPLVGIAERLSAVGPLPGSQREVKRLVEEGSSLTQFKFLSSLARALDEPGECFDGGPLLMALRRWPSQTPSGHFQDGWGEFSAIRETLELLVRERRKEMGMPDIRRTDTASLEIDATPEALYAAFADPEKLMRWLPPGSMTGRALEYDFREGGRYRIALTYEASAPENLGKTEGRTDVSAGRFLTLEPSRRIVQSGEFESADAAFAGEMRMTWSFEPTAAGTRVTLTAEDVPPGISREDHEEGLRSSLENLAKFVS